jgi:alpha-glucosidase
MDFNYENGKFSMTGLFEYEAGVNVKTITLLGVDAKSDGVEDADYDADNKVVILHVDVPLTGEYEASIA